MKKVFNEPIIEIEVFEDAVLLNSVQEKETGWNFGIVEEEEP